MPENTKTRQIAIQQIDERYGFTDRETGIVNRSVATVIKEMGENAFTTNALVMIARYQRETEQRRASKASTL